MPIIDSIIARDATSNIWAALLVPMAFRMFVAWSIEMRLRGLFRTHGVTRADFPMPNSFVRELPGVAIAAIGAWVPAYAITAVIPWLSVDEAHWVFLATAAAGAGFTYRRLRQDDRRSKAATARSGWVEPRPPWPR